MAGKAAEAAAPVVSRAAEAARPVADAGVKYVERTAGPVANDLAGKAAQTASAGAAATASDAIKKGSDLDPAARARPKPPRFAADKAADLAPSVASFGDFLQTATPVELVQRSRRRRRAVSSRARRLGAVASALAATPGPSARWRRTTRRSPAGTSWSWTYAPKRMRPAALWRHGRRAAGRVVSVPREKLSGNFKNMGDVEATLTATKIAPR